MIEMITEFFEKILGNEAVGKILGMAMAYAVSSLGLFLAYVNYRKRIVKADKVMTGTAWIVVAAVFLAIAGGVFLVAQLVEAPAETAAAPAEEAAPVEEAAAAPEPAAGEESEKSRWPLLGIVFPAGIFLFATWVTGALYHHFATHGHGGPAEEGGST